MLILIFNEEMFSLALVVHAYNPKLLGSLSQEDHDLRSAWANILPDPQSHQKRKKKERKRRNLHLSLSKVHHVTTLILSEITF
jgi:hypothetical protein